MFGWDATEFVNREQQDSGILFLLSELAFLKVFSCSQIETSETDVNCHKAKANRVEKGKMFHRKLKKKRRYLFQRGKHGKSTKLNQTIVVLKKDVQYSYKIR